MKSVWRGLGVLLVLSLCTLGCEQQAADTGGETDTTTATTATEPATTAAATQPAGGEGEMTPDEGRTFRVGFSQSNNAEPWRAWMNDTARKTAADYPQIELIFTDGEGDNNKQIANTENLIESGIDLLIISPNEAPALTPVVTRAYEQGIPVIVLDRQIQGDAYTTFIGADNYEIGMAAGAYVAETLDGAGTVFEIQGRLAATPTTGRHEGFHAVIEQYPDINVIGQQEGLYYRDTAMTLTEEILQTGQDIDLIYAHNDEMALGAYTVADNQGVTDEMLFVGIDGIPGEGRGLDAVKNGILDATFIYPNCGREAIETAVKILNGEEVEREYRLETATVTQENVDQFLEM